MLYSGFSKALDIYGFIEELKYYHRIPIRLHIFIGFSIPLIEIIIGILVWIPSLRVYIITCLSSANRNFYYISYATYWGIYATRMRMFW